MSNLTKHESASLAVVEEKTLVSYLDAMGLAQKLDQKEKTQFLQIAQASNLNPFKREIYAVKYGNTMSIMTGYEVYIKRAERTGLLNGWKVRTEGSVKNGDLKAIVTIFRKDQEIPFEWEALHDEYKQNNNFWRDKPITMTKKVGIAQAFRLCFSEELGGMPYTSDELPSETVDTHYHEVKKEAAPAPKKEETIKEVDPASVKQKTELLLLLNNKFIEAKEKADMLENINGMSSDRIEKAIAKIKQTIEQRKELASKESAVQDAEVVPDEPEQTEAPATPMTKGQLEVLTPLLSSPYLKDEEKDRIKSKKDSFSKEEAEKTINILLKWIRERKQAEGKGSAK